MKTVGMITIYRKNYGAFLQAYALQQLLIENEFKPEIIRYDYYKERSVLGISIDKYSSLFSFLKRLAVEVIHYPMHKKREKVFAGSIEKHIHESKAYYRTYSELKENPPNYDIYLTGSDQVFNLQLSPQAADARLLCFSKRGLKVSFAASSGTDTIPEKNLSKVKGALKSFSAISVRENGLRVFLEKEVGRPIYQNADPTLLLPRQKWLEFGTTNGIRIDEPFIFYYRVLNQEEIHKQAEYISKALNMPIFVADGNDKFSWQIRRNKPLSPEEWVGMMNKSSYVITNSFHGAAFSINLKKRATILIPPIGGERVTNLLKSCKIEESSVNGIMSENVCDIYKSAELYFIEERKKAIDFMKLIKGL